MNTRGFTEIVVLQVGLQLDVIDTLLYSLMVMMALVTTALTGPLLTLLERRNRARRPDEALSTSPSPTHRTVGPLA